MLRFSRRQDIGGAIQLWFTEGSKEYATLMANKTFWKDPLTKARSMLRTIRNHQI